MVMDSCDCLFIVVNTSIFKLCVRFWKICFLWDIVSVEDRRTYPPWIYGDGDNTSVVRVAEMFKAHLQSDNRIDMP